MGGKVFNAIALNPKMGYNNPLLRLHRRPVRIAETDVSTIPLVPAPDSLEDPKRLLLKV